VTDCAICNRRTVRRKGIALAVCATCRNRDVDEYVTGKRRERILEEHRANPPLIGGSVRGNSTLLAVWLEARKRAGIGFDRNHKLRRKPKSYWSPPPTARPAAGGTRKRGNCGSDGQTDGMPAHGQPSEATQAVLTCTAAGDRLST
jgi:hypothetical protein